MGGVEWAIGRAVEEITSRAVIFPRSAFRETVVKRLREETLLFIQETLATRT